MKMPTGSSPGSSTQALRLTLDELRRLLLLVDSRVRLLPAVTLRRVIREQRGITNALATVPHDFGYVISREDFLRCVRPRRREVALAGDWPDPVLLLPEPPADSLAFLPRSSFLLAYWRRLFHLCVHVAIEERLRSGQLTADEVHERIGRVGATAFAEIQLVLEQESRLLPPADEQIAYVEFAATYLELRHLSPALLPKYFPSLKVLDQIDAMLALDVDAAALVQQTRLAGAPDPEHVRPVEAASARYYVRLMQAAEQAGASGNDVRAVLLQTRAELYAPSEQIPLCRSAANGSLERLIQRLHAALDLSAEELQVFRTTLPALLPSAVQGIWPVSARLLYDLQRACIDHEQGIYSVDVIPWLMEWVYSLHRLVPRLRDWRRHPLKRLLPTQRELFLIRHLRRAHKRLADTPLSDAESEPLSGLFQAAIHRAEAQLRERLKPRLFEVFGRVGLKPLNLPEEVACHKVVEELLDRLIARGFLTLSDLRDALSRNQLKLPDVRTPWSWLRKDRLLRADWAMGETLEGVYRRGELYLRMLQRVSSLFFGTRLGRWVTWFGLVPFGGAFVLLVGLEHMFLHHGEAIEAAPPQVTSPVHIANTVARAPDVAQSLAPQHLASPITVAVLGLFIVGLLHVPRLRIVLVHLILSFGRILDAIIFGIPRWINNLALVRFLRSDPVFQQWWRYVLKPLLLSAPFWPALRLLGWDALPAILFTILMFVLLNVLLNSPVGDDVEEAISSSFRWGWQTFRLDMIPSTIRRILILFRQLTDALERLLYRGDEALRFRTGENPLMLIGKALASVGWFFVTYAVRLYYILLLEPNINPVKLPIVSMATKAMLPLYLGSRTTFIETFSPLGPVIGPMIAYAVWFPWPGVVGFLVWELKENWRLYRANEERLRPVVIGAHGETMRELLQPGFHSGTIPSLYRRLRHAQSNGFAMAARRYQASLFYAEHEVYCFIERELLELLRRLPGGDDLGLFVGHVELGVNSIRVEIFCPTYGAESLCLSFEERSGWLIAGIGHEGWLRTLAESKRSDWLDALVGVYKLAGADVAHGLIPLEKQLLTRLPVREVSGTHSQNDGIRVPARTSGLGDAMLQSPGTLSIVGKFEDCAPLLREFNITWAEWVARWAQAQVRPDLANLPALSISQLGEGLDEPVSFDTRAS